MRRRAPRLLQPADQDVVAGGEPLVAVVPDHIARAALAELMGRLGYERFVCQGGDWGAIVSSSRLYWENKDNVFNAMFNARTSRFLLA